MVHDNHTAAPIRPRLSLDPLPHTRVVVAIVLIVPLLIVIAMVLQ